MIRVHLGSARASSLQPSRITPLLLSGLAAFVIGVAGHAAFPPFVSPEAVETAFVATVATAQPVINEIAGSAPVQAALAAATGVNREVRQATAAVAPKPEIVTREVELAAGNTFAGMLTDADVSPEDALAVAAALNKVYQHKKLKGGQEVTLAFSRLGDEESLIGVTFQPETTKEVSVVRETGGEFTGSVSPISLDRQRFAVRAEIRSSLYEAGEREGVPHAVMAALLRAYAHAVDFQRDIRPGDKFEVLYDQSTTKNGTPVGQGVIIYAALQVAGKVMPLYRVTFADGTVDYFDERGQSIKRALLRTPVDGAHVTSGYGMRRHPLLGYSKMHQGTDFGAATGTPIFAAGAGIVAEAGFKGSYGRFILLRHNGRIETAYAHMSRFARGMHPGARVNQGDVIGFVGSSGRSTGPHLHYEVRVGRNQINPLSVNLPTGRVLGGKLLAQFRDGQAKIKREFAGLLAKEPSTAVAQTGNASFIKASVSAPAFGNAKPAASCGLRGGC
ncbi:MAG: M23 family metallopeptidase [Alphaproteobacteria bacterium]|nr:M23 family metallopeptidase [Alphaproteobacteria bacterium]